MDQLERSREKAVLLRKEKSVYRSTPHPGPWSEPTRLLVSPSGQASPVPVAPRFEDAATERAFLAERFSATYGATMTYFIILTILGTCRARVCARPARTRCSREVHHSPVRAASAAIVPTVDYHTTCTDTVLFMAYHHPDSWFVSIVLSIHAASIWRLTEEINLEPMRSLRPKSKAK